MKQLRMIPRYSNKTLVYPSPSTPATMLNLSALNCIDNTFRVWEKSHMYSQALRNLSQKMRNVVQRARKGLLCESQLDSIRNLYEWICDTLSSKDPVPISLAAERAANRLSVMRQVCAYYESIGGGAVIGEDASAAAEPAPVAPLTPAPAPATSADKDNEDTESESEIVILEEKEPLLPPHDYMAVKAMIAYFNDKITMTYNEDRLNIIIRKYEYLLDKDNFMAYDAEFRNNCMIYLDMIITMYQMNPGQTQQLVLVRSYMQQLLDRIHYNRYFRTITI